jgi:diguanylate cyclase (GGDEF)-like protein
MLPSSADAPGHEERRVARALNRRYLIALTLIALLATAAWSSIHLVISQQESNAAIVNVSGRQRMLSQRTSLYAVLLVNSRGSDAQVRQTLRSAVNLMQRSHRALTRGDEAMGLPAEMSEQVRAMYFQQPLALDRQVREYLGHVESLLATAPERLTPDNADLQRITHLGPGPLLTSLDKMVNQYQSEGEAAVSRLQKVETLVWISTLLLLLLEALFIFRPIARQVRSVIRRLRSLSEDLSQAKAGLEQRVQERTAELERIAHFDPLTNVPNRRHLSSNLNRAISRAHRRGSSLAVCFMDLDHFKPINDRHGHAFGDELLIVISDRLLKVMRTEDILGRLGGDEFALILDEVTDRQEIVPVLDRVLETVAQEIELDGVQVRVSASIGVTLYPEDAADADTLLRHADHAMYLAKGAGKNCYQFFDPENDRQLQAKAEGLRRFAQALASDELILHYQPKVNMRTGAVIGVEALVRWQHPEQGLLQPGDFLPGLADQPLMIELGDWVLGEALRQIERWKAEGLQLPVSVNVDATQIEQPDFIDHLRDLLAQHPQVAQGDLELEVLETSALEDIALVSRVIRDCQQLGVGFALDDFGTGYSSLLYLKGLPAQMLKIDRSFIRDMLDDPDDLAILEGILGLTLAFRRYALAEGVETEAHGQMLLRMNCPLAQGYAIARPMPAESLPAWLGDWRPFDSWRNTPRCRRDDTPVLFALVEHRAWVGRLERFLRDESDDLPPLDLYHCRFGQWLEEDGRSRFGDASIRQIESLHGQVHELAHWLIEQGREDPETTLQELTQLHALRDQLVQHLIGLLAEEEVRD